MKALLFPGQGSQVVGMCAEFYKNFNSVKKIFEEANEILKFDISKIILEGPESELKLTKNTQPAILTVSFSIFNVLKKEFNLRLEDFKYFAGHSLGEYSALLCSESLNFSDALNLLHERGKAMQEAVPLGQGGMIAVLGAEIEDVDKLISKNKHEGVCEIANDNANGQVIVSGDISSIKNFQKILDENKKKFRLLPVSAPFHCSLMKSAAEKMEKKIKPVSFNKPIVGIFSNVTASAEEDPDKIKNLLIQQIFSKVRWRESIINMSKFGVREFIEIGPGKVLSGLVKRIIKDCKINNINSLDNIKDVFKWISKIKKL